MATNADENGSKAPKRAARDTIISLLRRELMGPFDGPREQFSGEYPTSRYIVGRLAPFEQAISAEENDTLAAGEEEDEAGPQEEPLPLILGFHPSSIGLSFLLDPRCRFLDARLTWGDYLREGNDQSNLDDEDGGSERTAARGGAIWQRHPRETLVRKIPIPLSGRLSRIPLDPALSQVEVSGFYDASISLEGVVHKVGEQLAVSLFVVNRRQKLELSNRRKDERWMLQVQLELSSSDGSAVFLARHRPGELETEEAEAQSYELLYRNCKEFAAGHGVATNWFLGEERIFSRDAASRKNRNAITRIEPPHLLRRSPDGRC